MVDFVLDNPGQKALCLKTHFVASGVECLNADFSVAGYFAINVADTEAAFVIRNYLTLYFYLSISVKISQGEAQDPCKIMPVLAYQASAQPGFPA